MLSALTSALPTLPAPARLARLQPATLRALLLTLLFLTMVGLRRTCDLRGYTGSALALLTGRRWAYGARNVERFLAQVAQAGAADRLTTALAQWTAELWLPTTAEVPTLTVYIDGHRKAVYSDKRLPRGLVARYGVVEGCRALVLLHDAHGHPLLVTTHRGDTHLTIGLPQILARYEQTVGRRLVTQIIVDREGMGAEFLAGLVADGRTVVTLLRADQYRGLEAFSEVGEFVPLVCDRDGTVLREVAPARFALALPEQPGESLPLWVALVRELRCQLPLAPAEDDLPRRWDADLSWEERDWRSAEWSATPAPKPATTAKLIAIVATSPIVDATALARTYFRRWPVQENIIRDFLIPLGIDTNHGYAKREVVNSEVAKRRSALSERLERLKRWAVAAGERCRRASQRHLRLYAAAKERARELGNVLFKRQRELEEQGVSEGVFRREMQAAREETHAEMDDLNGQIRRAVDTCDQEFHKQERYCKDQREVLRALEELGAREPQMYELDDAKDQVMTVCKVAVANLAMWTRERYFPEGYGQATWKRLEPFFKLSGRVRWGAERVEVELRQFTDRQLNRDLAALCRRVAAAKPHLPDGRQLIFTICSPNRLTSDDHSEPLA